MISCVVTTFQRPLLLKRAIESLRNQTYSSIRICVYDNSPDHETELMMQELMKKDYRINYYRHGKDIGMMSNYKFAFSQIKTRYFSFLSDDDYVLPDFYETALKGFSAYPEAIFSACGVSVINEQGEVVHNSILSWGKEGYYKSVEGALEMINTKGKLLYPGGLLFNYEKSELIIKRIFNSYDNNHYLRWDTDFIIQAAVKDPIVISKKNGAVFVSHEHSLSTRFFNKLYSNKKNIFLFIKETSRIQKSIVLQKELLITDKNKLFQSFFEMSKKELFSICKDLCVNKGEKKMISPFLQFYLWVWIYFYFILGFHFLLGFFYPRKRNIRKRPIQPK